MNPCLFANFISVLACDIAKGKTQEELAILSAFLLNWVILWLHFLFLIMIVDLGLYITSNSIFYYISHIFLSYTFTSLCCIILISNMKTSEHKKITDNFLSAIYGSFARDVFEKFIAKEFLFPFQM